MEKAFLESLLYSTAILTFEDLGFLLPDDGVSEEQGGASFRASARIHFRGPSEGYLCIRLYGGFLPELTANMLGEEEIPSEEDQADALGELSNVICGNLLPSMAGLEAVFNLDAPEVQVGGEVPEAPAQSLTASCVVGIDDGRVELDIHDAVTAST